MNANKFNDLLHELYACSESVRWAHGKDLHEVWTTCERGDWLLWLAGRMADKPRWPTRKNVVLAACACAETALKFVHPGEDRPRFAIETARGWVRGEASIEDVRRAADASAYAASAAAYAASAYAAAASAYDASASAYAAAASAYDAYAAAAAAYDAADASAYDAYAYDARAKALAKCADLVRQEIREPLS